ncbi:hypothetical protein HD554DRAFT_2132406 [Boletus coccyginus]|nr:hypothetical protein HD554DRAFT_2132406 [Boletus coccyginus]
MGFPAVGVESIYRNHRADVQRFLSARHGSDFWVFNFCPLRENAYHESVFGGRVSRYPFPDHHVPPFFYLPLVTREIHAWLSGSDARVAVLHCKAGKGRSGTLACAYLLSPSGSMLRSLHDSFSDWSLIGDKEGLQTPSEDSPTVLSATMGRSPVHPASAPASADLSRVSSEPAVNTLEKVLNHHASRRMKPSRDHPDIPKKTRMGVSIPSQQRWLLYWSQVLGGKGPPSLRPFPANDHPEHQDTTPKITKLKLTKLTIRMREPSRIQPHLVQAASAVITSAGKGRAASEFTTGRLWASLARYSDQLVDELEHWEKESRNPAGAIGSSFFKNDRWDKAKMIRSFAQMGISAIQPSQQGESSRPVLTYVLRPLCGAGGDWVKLCEQVPVSNRDNPQQCMSASESSYTVVSPPAEAEDPEDPSGVLLEADRELRIKLFMGEVALGWVWLIPAFHISPDSSSSSLVISSDDIDFAIGIGKALVDMKISFAYCT